MAVVEKTIALLKHKANNIFSSKEFPSAFAENATRIISQTMSCEGHWRTTKRKGKLTRQISMPVYSL